MVKQVIEIGTAPAGQDGDTNREASIKCNSNFTELYTAIANAVRGPASAIGGEVAVFSGTTGKDIVGGGVLGSAAFRVAGAANGVATLNASTKVPIAQLPTGANGLATLGADGKLPTAQLPPLAVNEVFTVASQAAMLALVAERGDVAVRSDQSGKTYILSQDDPTVLANWIPLQQALSAALAALNALTPAADRIPFFTGPSTADLLPITTIGKALIAVADAVAARTAISAAKSGANSDITSLSGITTPLTVGQGGTSRSSVAGYLTDLKTAGAYAKDNIVGTVSMASGIPSGGIVERGTVANVGDYIRYADGTQICWFTFPMGSVGLAPIGALYQTTCPPLAFPKAFIGPPNVKFGATASGADVWATEGQTFATAGATQPSLVMSATGTTRQIYLSYIAIGRWFN